MRSRRNLVIGMAIITVAAIVGCGAGLYVYLRLVGDALSELGNNTCDPQTPTITEELGQFKFPPSMRNPRSWCWGMQGWWGTAQFEMSPSDLDYFVSHLQITPPLASSGIPANRNLATKASTVKSFLHGSYRIIYRPGKKFVQDVLIDTSDPTQYLVYVEFGGG